MLISGAKVVKNNRLCKLFNLFLRLSHELREPQFNFASEILVKGNLRVKLFCNYRVMRSGTEHNRELGRDVISEQRGIMQDE